LKGKGGKCINERSKERNAPLLKWGTSVEKGIEGMRRVQNTKEEGRA
jgi:hypothetical protein